MIPAIRKPSHSLLSVKSVLRHLSVVTYAIEPERLRPHIPLHFDLEIISDANQQPLALLSVVTFLNQDFHFAHLPWPKWSFGQTNYRVYIKIGDTRAVWFLGTRLGSRAYKIPRLLWGMPWHYGRYQFHTATQNPLDPLSPYTQLHIEASTHDHHTAQRLTLRDTGHPVGTLPGFPSPEDTLVTLTQPLVGYYSYRQNKNKTNTYSIWHAPYTPRLASLIDTYDLFLHNLDLVSPDAQLHPHSVILQPISPYIIYLPPHPYTPKITQSTNNI